MGTAAAGAGSGLGSGAGSGAAALFDLTGRVALVTGGNGGLGLAMARGLAGAGADVALVGRKADKNRSALEGLKRDFPGRRLWAFEADVTQEDQAGRAVEGAAAAAGRLDILINNAGGNLRKPPQDYALDEWRRLLDDNLTSAFLCSRAAHPHLKRSGRGKVVNIGSMTSVLGAGWAAPYSAAKGGIRLFTKSLAVAWAGDGIQVNCLMPGFIDTDLSRAARVAVPGLERRVLDRTPAGRWGRPEDLVGTAVFLCSPASDFVTGTEIAVDGGYSAAL